MRGSLTRKNLQPLISNINHVLTAIEVFDGEVKWTDSRQNIRISVCKESITLNQHRLKDWINIEDSSYQTDIDFYFNKFNEVLHDIVDPSFWKSRYLILEVVLLEENKQSKILHMNYIYLQVINNCLIIN